MPVSWHARKTFHLCLEHSLFFQDSHLFPSYPYTHWKLTSWLGPFGSFFVNLTQMHSICLIFFGTCVLCSDSLKSLLHQTKILPLRCTVNILGQGAICSLYCIILQGLLNPLFCESMLSAVPPMDPLLLHPLEQERALWKETTSVRMSAYHWSLGNHPLLRITWEGQIFALWLSDNFPEVVRHSYKGH